MLYGDEDLNLLRMFWGEKIRRDILAAVAECTALTIGDLLEKGVIKRFEDTNVCGVYGVVHEFSAPPTIKTTSHMLFQLKIASLMPESKVIQEGAEEALDRAAGEPAPSYRRRMMQAVQSIHDYWFVDSFRIEQEKAELEWNFCHDQAMWLRAFRERGYQPHEN